VPDDGDDAVPFAAASAAAADGPGAKRRRSEGGSSVPRAPAPSLLALADPLTVDLGAGVLVSAVGLGTLPLGVAYPNRSLVPDATGAHAVLAAAAAGAAPLRLFVDCADTYCLPFTATRSLERTLGAAARAFAGGTCALTTKSGMRRISDESTGWRPAAISPASVRADILASRAAFAGGEGASGSSSSSSAAAAALAPAPPLFLWSLHHCDALEAPGALEAALGAAVACVNEGSLLHVGLCNAAPRHIRRALAVTKLLCVQNKWSPWERAAEKPEVAGAGKSSEAGALALCAERGVVFVAYGALGGLKARQGERDVGSRDAVARVAAARGCSPAAVVIAALLHRGRRAGARVIVLAGARAAAHAADSCTAGPRLRLDDAEVDAVLPPV